MSYNDKLRAELGLTNVTAQDLEDAMVVYGAPSDDSYGG